MDRRTQQTASAQNIFAALPAFNGTAARILLWPVQTWLHLQSEFLAAAAPATEQWIARRQQGTAEALKTIEKLSRCKDVQEAASVQSEWLKDESKRLEEDMRSLGDQTLVLTRAAEKASREGAQMMTASGP